MGKKPKRSDFLGYAYPFLDLNWPIITKKLGLRTDTFEKPIIRLTTKDSKFEAPVTLKINYDTVLKAYHGKEGSIQGLKIKHEDMLKDDIIHECIHYLQDQFYDVFKDCYSYITEGLASLIPIEIHLKNKDYGIAVTSIADYFIETGEEYRDYFGLSKEHNQHIEKVIKEGIYKPIKREPCYSKGFMFICKTFKTNKQPNHYIELLIDPLENDDLC